MKMFRKVVNSSQPIINVGHVICRAWRKALGPLDYIIVIVYNRISQIELSQTR